MSRRMKKIFRRAAYAVTPWISSKIQRYWKTLISLVWTQGPNQCFWKRFWNIFCDTRMLDIIEQNTEVTRFFAVSWYQIGPSWSCLQWSGVQTFCFLLSVGSELLQIFRVLANSHYSRRYNVFNNVVFRCSYCVRSSTTDIASSAYSYVSSHDDTKWS